MIPSAMPSRTTWPQRRRELGEPRLAKSRRPRRSPAEFTPRVKLLVRKRAGDGDPEYARCEDWNCSVFLGRHGGDYQHVVARGAGGSRNPLLGSAANCLLLCRRSHDLAESRESGVEATVEKPGLWARRGTDPRMVPMMLPRPGLVMVWRSEDGRYLYEQPTAVAA